MSKLMVREIPNYFGYYISKCGQVYSTRRPRKMHVLKGTANGRGYKYVDVHDVTGKRHAMLVHRLVLLTYVGYAPEGCPEACHKNGNPLDNRLENLYWGSHQGNMDDMVKHGNSPRGERSGMSKLKEVQVREIKRSHYEKEKTLYELADIYGMEYSTVKNITRGKRWKHVAPEHTVQPKFKK